MAKLVIFVTKCGNLTKRNWKPTTYHREGYHVSYKFWNVVMETVTNEKQWLSFLYCELMRLTKWNKITLLTLWLHSNSWKMTLLSDLFSGSVAHTWKLVYIESCDYLRLILTEAFPTGYIKQKRELMWL